ncbi:PaaI family thioesterase [Gordonibacter sp. Marseille-P4307]|uniref:PaaI family thioesterase n=1 Tax=Gordonibacter sp. Marseille-P4307 TaxID=2161815 RepID=UPI0013DE4FE5|nr:PaaI family thioesterase [Gordonibacter sp. Marseille-P4307]
MAKELNPAWVSEVLELINESPYLQALGIEVNELGEGYARGGLTVERTHLNAFGGMHGGMFASLIDNITYWAMYALLPEGMGATTLDVHGDYLRSCTAGDRVSYEGRVVKMGGTVILCECDVFDGEGRILAHGTSKILASKTIQPAEAMYANLRPGYVLPPKFLGD